MNRFTHTALFVCFFYAIGFAQTKPYDVCIQVIGATGKATSRDGMHFTYTVGEPVILTRKGGIYTLTQGFHQPDLCVTVSTHDLDLAAWSIEVFPNPAMDFLTVRFDSEKSNALNISVFDLLGQAVITDRPLTDPNGSLLSCSDWQPGIYLLQLQDPATKAVATVRVVKAN